MVKANLIVSYDPSHISSAKDEVSNILKDIKGEAKFLKPNIDGVFEINVKNAKNTVKKLNKEFAKRKKLFERTFHWVPIDKWCKAEIKKMQAEIKKFAKKVKMLYITKGARAPFEFITNNYLSWKEIIL